MAQMETTGAKSLVAGEELLKFRRVRINASRQYVYAEAGEGCHGITTDNFASGEHATALLKSAPGTRKVTLSASCSAGAKLYPGADGKVSPVAVGDAEFIALDAASGDGSVVEAVMLNAQGGIEVPSSYRLVEQFARLPALNADNGVTKNLDWEADAEAGFANTDIVFAVGGGIVMSTPAATPAANDYTGVRPHLDATQTGWAVAGTWGSENSPVFEARLAVASLTACAVVAGFFEDAALPADLEVIGSDDNAAFFFFSDDGTVGSANWQAVENIDTADTRTDLGVAAAAGVDVHLMIVVDSARRAHFFVNGSLRHSGAPLKDAVNFVPKAAVMTDTTAQKAMTLREIACARAV